MKYKYLYVKKLSQGFEKIKTIKVVGDVKGIGKNLIYLFKFQF